MNKQLLLVMVASSLVAFLPNDSFSQPKGKQLVQSQIDKLNDTLAHTSLNYKNRKHIEAYLRRYFNNKKTGKPLKLKKPLVGNEKDVANVITNSYENITRTAGSHHRAADHYAAQATGLVALYKKPAGMKGVTPSRSAEGGLMGTLGGMLGTGGKAKTTEGTTGIGGTSAKKTETHPTTGTRNGKASTIKKAKGAHKTPAQKLEKKKRKAAKKVQRKQTPAKKISKKKQEKKARKLKKAKTKSETV